jgi:hypothetical protein
MVERAGYLLRIATKQWVNQVFEMAIYYTSVRRKWKTGQNILFVHKTEAGDAIVGYGMIENMYEKDSLSEEEKNRCEKYGWKKAIEFKYVVKFNKPLLVKETVLKSMKIRGRLLHGLSLNGMQVESIISQAEHSQL